MAPKIFYVPPSPPCQLVILVAKHLNIELDLIKMHPYFDEPTPEFLKANPARTIPAMVDNGFYLAESRPIAIYLLEKYGKNDPLLPNDPETKATVLQRLFFDESLWERGFRGIVRLILYEGQLPKPEAYKKLDDRLNILNTYLQDSKWLAGENITLADYSTLATLTALQTLGVTDVKKFPKVAEWFERAKKAVDKYEEIVAKPVATLRNTFDEKLASLKAQNST